MENDANELKEEWKEYLKMKIENRLKLHFFAYYDLIN
jgi:hypothetical protein